MHFGLVSPLPVLYDSVERKTKVLAHKSCALAEMNDAVFITLIVTGFTVAFLHAAIPTHWLPFVVAARAQRWNPAKTLIVTGVAGSGHVLFTPAFGGLIWWCGILPVSTWGRAVSAVG